MSLQLNETLADAAYRRIRDNEMAMHIQLPEWIARCDTGMTLADIYRLHGQFGNAIDAIDVVISNVTSVQALKDWAEALHSPGYDAAAEYQTWKAQVVTIRNGLVSTFNGEPSSVDVEGGAFIASSRLGPLKTALQTLQTLGA